MSNIKIILLVVGLPAFLVSMYFLGLYIKNSSHSTVAGPSITSPTPFNKENNAASGPTALLTKESGTVTYQLPGSSELKTLDKDDIEVPTGTTVKTGETSFAHVVFPDNSLMSLSKNTEVTLNFEDKKIKIVQLLGNTWHRVEKVLQGNSYEVETPNTLATVRGTEFNVGVLADNQSEVYVMKSTVDVSKISTESGKMVVEDTAKVTQDHHIVLDPKKPLKVVDLEKSKKQTDWFKRNIQITEEIQQAEEDAAKKKGLDISRVASESAGATPDPAMDEIKHSVRTNMMLNIKDDTQLKTIDAQFPTPTPSTDTKKKLNLDTTSKAKAGDVLGTNTRIVSPVVSLAAPVVNTDRAVGNNSQSTNTQLSNSTVQIPAGAAVLNNDTRSAIQNAPPAAANNTNDTARSAAAAQTNTTQTTNTNTNSVPVGQINTSVLNTAQQNSAPAVINPPVNSRIINTNLRTLP